jgi:CDP-glycerol glycerophosphotransferase
MLKYVAIHIVRFLLTAFYIFPINKKKIFFSGFSGKKFFCNSKYIFMDIYEKMPQLKYVWCMNQYCEELSKYPNVIKVKHKTLSWIFHVLTANVIIFNTDINTFLPYRKN